MRKDHSGTFELARQVAGYKLQVAGCKFAREGRAPPPAVWIRRRIAPSPNPQPVTRNPQLVTSKIRTDPIETGTNRIRFFAAPTDLWPIHRVHSRTRTRVHSTLR